MKNNLRTSAESADNSDPEYLIQEPEGWLVAVIVLAIGLPIILWIGLKSMPRRFWQALHYRKDCCYCKPHHRISGNPFVRRKNRSHGICLAQLEREKKRIFERGTATLNEQNVHLLNQL
jgi:hypothetical protein